MKKTIDLLNEVVAMGFSRESELCEIDIQELRKPLEEEEIPCELYEDILYGFLCEKECC